MSDIQKREITQELQESYLDYAMSVIVARALPDIRDGLKPVHRRVMWAMWDSGNTAQSKFRKSANVVGETMGKYHPHGDASIYDTLVRLAQEFSMRYPLVWGQGNFGCFTKDTKVKLADGRDLSFEELVEEDQVGKKNFTYTVNNLGLIAIAEVEHPRLTRKDAKIIKVTLDSGQSVRCTPDHRFMLKDGSYKEARCLTSQDSLMPLYQKLSEKEDRFNREGYILVYQPKKDEWVPAHHLADNYNLTKGTYRISAGRVRHHMDFNKLNNSPLNIRRVGWQEHWQIHYQHASEQHRDPVYREKVAKGRQAYWANPANRGKKAQEISRRNVENWKLPQYRARMREFLSEANKKYITEHPEKRKEFSARATKTLKRLWQDPAYRALFHEKIIKGNQNHTTNRTGRLKFLKIAGVAIQESPILNRETYEQARRKVYPYGAAPLWETGLAKYFASDPDLARQAVSKNHKIVLIEDAGHEDVYDLTVGGTHNFALADGVFVHNSIDGDSAAAMRYTEARLARISDEMLGDIDKETVDWAPNYDATREEPKVLPAKLPNLILNGSLGIAVGMATSIPPHNLKEVSAAILHLADHPDASHDELMDFVQGPDFPTGGVIFDKKAIREAYASGRGGILCRAKADVEERKNRQFDIIITEIPYQVNKSELIKRIAELVQEKKVEGIRDVRDESDREGLRIVIELKNDVPPQKILNQLYKHTDLQKDFHLNMIALVDGINPRLLSLKEILVAYLDHRKIIVRRRTEFDLKKAEERAHILQGLSKALDAIDRVIATIKKSKSREDAHQNLVKQFKLSDVQATAILEMRLQTLAALERQKIEDELKEKLALIKDLQLVLKSPAKVLQVVKTELKELTERYGDERRTQVVKTGVGEFKEEDLIPDEEAVITVSAGGYVKRLPPGTFRTQKRGGKGLIGSDVAEEDFLTHFLAAKTHDNILFFTDKGRVFQTKIYEIPPGTRTSKGRGIHNFLEMPTDENARALVSYGNDKKSQDASLIMVTTQGVIKRTPLEDFKNIRRNGILALALKKGDSLKDVRLSRGKCQIVITTVRGQSIRFKESQVRAMGRTAAGIRGIRLKRNDAVAGFDIIQEDEKDKGKEGRLLVVMANGFGKQTLLKEYKIQNRGGSGIRTANITAKTGSLIAAAIVTDETEILTLSAKGQVIRTALQSVRQTGRSAQGVRIMNLRSGDRLAGVIII